MKPVKPTADSITCPKCGQEIAVTQTLREQISQQARAEVREEINKKEKNIAAREKALERKEKEADARVLELLAAKTAKLEKDAKAAARAESRAEVEALAKENAEKDRQLQAAQKNEFDLRREKRALEAAKKSNDLEVARRVDAERDDIREAAFKQAAEEHRFKDAEKDKKLADALKINEDLTRKLQQGSQQIQGEVLEIGIESLLRDCSPTDEITPVPKGVKGADVIQVVKSRSGSLCGRLIWEMKHTKKWNDEWVSKLKDDQQRANADIAVIVTDALPESIEHFGTENGVWITNSKYVRELAAVLRAGLEHTAQIKRSVAGKNETVEIIYAYLTGPEFANRVEAIMGAFMEMKDGLEKEKRTTHARWSEREKQLERVFANTGGMYGDLQGLTGRSLRPIPALDEGESEFAPNDHLALVVS